MFLFFKKEKFRPGHVLPQPECETSTGRNLYTVGQIREAYEQGLKDSRSLLVRSRNILSHPQYWCATDEHSETRKRLSEEISIHLNGLSNSKAWTEAEK